MAAGCVVTGQVPEPGNKPGSCFLKAVPHTTLFFLQEVHRTVSMHLTIVSPGLPGELSLGLSGVLVAEVRVGMTNGAQQGGTQREQPWEEGQMGCLAARRKTFSCIF